MTDTLLTTDDIQFFRVFRKGTQGLFDLGDRTRDILERARSAGLADMLVYHAVAEEAGLGWRRVEKLAHVAGRFPKSVRAAVRKDMPFAYFEEALVFDGQDARSMLDYVEQRLAQDFRWPPAQMIANDFRREILGLHVGSQPGVTVHIPEDPPYKEMEQVGEMGGVPVRVSSALQKDRVVLLAARPAASPLDHPGYVEKRWLVEILAGWKKKYDAGELTVDACIYDLANLLAG